ncbi:MAG: DUF4848 domain-containing protein [Bacteroidaceae bacterium]|nr:DUF4848 domain-containing protein [Bacteroidaceae bacterium]
MKQLLFGIAIVTCATLSSCSTDDYLSESFEDNNLSTLAEKGKNDCDKILSFASEVEYQAILDSLSRLSHKELLEWEASNKFHSMYHCYTDASDDILTSQNAADYFAKKNLYSHDFIFNDGDMEDLSIYMPVLSAAKAVTLSPKGLVRIGGELKCMKEFSDYAGYIDAVNRKYPVLLSRNTIEDGINRVYVRTSDRKFSAQIGVEFGQQGIRVNASKKLLWGWYEYTTAYYWRLSPDGPVMWGQEVASGHDIPIPRPFENGTKLYMWSRGVGEENRAVMTVNL